MGFLVHAMEYTGEAVHTDLEIRHYAAADYSAYKRVYEACFYEMRTALGLRPTCCGDALFLMENRHNIYVLKIDGSFVGSVRIHGNEIDDLIVAKEFQKKGYGRQLLLFAVGQMQKREVHPIILHVADWNKNAIRLYEKNDFVIFQSETITPNK